MSGVTLERVTVAEEQEAGDAGWNMAPVLLYWSYDTPPPAGARMVFLRSINDRQEPLDTIPVAELPGAVWGDRQNPLPLIRSERYSIYLVDEDGDAASPMSFIHGTILLYNPDPVAGIDPCRGSILLQWNNYTVTDGEDPVAPPFTHNQVLVTPPGGGEYVAATLDFTSAPADEYEYVFDHGPGPYRFRIRAVERIGGVDHRTSHSNAWTVSFQSSTLSDLDIWLVDVAAPDQVRVTFEAIGDVDAFEYRILRSRQRDQGFEEAGVVPAADLKGGLGVFEDQVAAGTEGPWYYRVHAFLAGGNCADPSLEAGPVSSLWLEAGLAELSETSLLVDLQWEQDPSSPVGFELFRSTGGGPFTSVGLYTESELSARDDLSDQLGTIAGEILYFLQADMPGGKARSNVVPVFLEPEIKIYNAFNPNSLIEANRHFRPVFINFLPDFVRLRVFNRWGQEIYAERLEEDIGQWVGWDGRTREGEEAPQGTYAFHLEVGLPGGDILEKRGTVLLLR